MVFYLSFYKYELSFVPFRNTNFIQPILQRGKLNNKIRKQVLFHFTSNSIHTGIWSEIFLASEISVNAS
jgi:hypothetical protein